MTGSLGKYGLLGMQERADLIGAHLQIESAPGSGCLVTLTKSIQPPLE